jgi:acyl carrier protein
MAEYLPHYMIPSIFLYLDHIPFTTNGKIDKNALPLPFFQSNIFLKCDDSQSIENRIQAIWSEILSINNFNKNLSFFDLGGNSLKIMKVKKELEIAFELKINVVDLFQYTTLHQLSQHISSLKNSFKKEKTIKQVKKESNSSFTSVENEPIAIIGMACRLPGGIVDPESFWELLLAQDSTIRDFSAEELRQQHRSEFLIANESFVKRGSILENAHYFDANFFGYSERDAELMDPQQRHFLECAWEALEKSGNVPEKFVGDIGVFASQGKNYYYTDYILSNPAYKEKVNAYQAMLGNEKDFLATKVSFKLNLSGPSLTPCRLGVLARWCLCKWHVVV